MKQTAVEWLVEQVNSDCLNSTFIRPDIIEQAKTMFEKQMIDFAEDCLNESDCFFNVIQQYNEKFK